ncbi:MAG: glutamyl-tRNA reductase, partial [Planctomycetota bacterium]
AVEHLFRLASGLDSMIVGESEILGQIKNAYAVSQEAQTAGDVFHRLFPAAISTGKRVRTQTEISKGCITPGQAALNVAIEALGDLSSRSVLLIGSGKIATITARALLESGISRFEISNRTHERAEELAGTLGDSSVDIKVTPWEELDMALARASVVITSTGSTEPLLTSERLEASQAKRHHEKQIIVDLAIPRDVAPESGDVEGIELFNIDDLNGVIQENIRQRHSHIPVAESIVREQIHTFVGRMSYFLQVEPVIRHMYERFEEIRLGALQSTVDGFPPELHEQVDQLTRNLVRKLIHFPISRLKALRDLGGLRDEEVLFLKKMFPTDPS